MTVKIEQGKDIFELNPGLQKLFPKLSSDEMEYVVYVADALSILRMQPMKKRREIALKMVEGCWVNGRPTAKGTRFADGKNKDIEKAIIVYNDEINDAQFVIITETLTTLRKYYIDVLKYFSKLDNVKNAKFDEQQKIFAQNAKSIKDGTLKETHEQILYFQKQLGYEFEIPAEVEEETKEKVETDKFGADNIDVDKL